METEKKFFVYVDFRGDDGKPFYVGKGTERRVQDLQRNELHSRIKNKHGIIRKVVFETHSEQDTFDKEVQLIQELQTHIDHGNGGANFTFGGEGGVGYKFTEEQKEKMSESHKKKWENPEYRAKMLEMVKTHWEDPEFKAKMKEVHNDLKTKKKKSEAVKKLWEDPEHREKMSESRKKMWEDPEAKKKMRESMKKKWEDPEYRAKVLIGKEKKKLEKLQSEI